MNTMIVDHYDAVTSLAVKHLYDRSFPGEYELLEMLVTRIGVTHLIGSFAPGRTLLHNMMDGSLAARLGWIVARERPWTRTARQSRHWLKEERHGPDHD